MTCFGVSGIFWHFSVDFLVIMVTWSFQLPPFYQSPTVSKKIYDFDLSYFGVSRRDGVTCYGVLAFSGILSVDFLVTWSFYLSPFYQSPTVSKKQI